MSIVQPITAPVPGKVIHSFVSDGRVYAATTRGWFRLNENGHSWDEVIASQVRVKLT